MAKRDTMSFNLQEYAGGTWLTNSDSAGNADGANPEDSDYYIVYSWGSSTNPLDWLDLRGH